MIENGDAERVRIALTRLKGGASLLVLVTALCAAPALAQQPVPAPPQEPLQEIPPEEQTPGAEGSSAEAAVEAQEEALAGDEIVVTGFRASLNAALNVKRESVSTVDAIIAEDIAQFPDQNIAESLQRIPGISIQRDAGEGQSITVRGLGSQFTRVRLNGLETVATSTQGAGANRGRDFDFNVFASELFTSVIIHKTAEASLDEGSLGAVVDLNTGNPLSGKSGLTLAVSAQASYNDLSDKVGPRLAGLLAWRNDAGTFGASISAAYSNLKTLELGNNTVRWAQARFDSVAGTPCWTQPNSGGTYVPSAPCDEAALAFHPRIPRYGEVGHDRERLGLTASVQFEPTERTRLSLDGLYSRFREDRREKWGEVLFRSNERSIDIVDYEIDPATNSMISATVNDAWVRTEHFLLQSETEFHQLSASWDQDLTDRLRFTLLGGFSESDASIPVETTIIFDDRDAQGYRFDYSDGDFPLLSFGTDVTDPANFQLAEIRDRPSSIVNKFRTAQLRTEYDLSDNLRLLAGAMYRRFSFDTEQFSRDTAVCPSAGGPDLVLGIITCTPNTVFGPGAVYGFPVTPDLATLFKLGDAGQPSGNTDSWLIPDLEAGAAFTGLYNRPAAVIGNNTRGVVESVTGGYFQANAKGHLGGLRYALNAGVRYARTRQTSTGIATGGEIEVKRRYEDWLPSGNLALYPTDDIIIRAAAAKVITRPTLGNLTPGGTADGFNFRVNFGNPFLNPFRATNYDLGIEWYFAPESIFSVALFYKDVAAFPVRVTRTGSFNETGLPVSALVPSSPAALDPALRAADIWSITTFEDGAGANIKGVELALQMPFRFLPGALSNLGGLVNATLIDSDTEYTGLVGPQTTPGVNPPPLDRKAPLFNLSKRAVNATLYYDDGRFSARGSLSYRSSFIDATGGNNNVFEGYDSTINVDAAVRYKVTGNIELSLEGINLTDEYRGRFVDIDARRPYENNHFGRTFLVGVRYTM